MELEAIRKFENKEHLNIALKNNFVYSDICFTITEDNLIQFLDRNGDTITIEPFFIMLISEQKKRNDNYGYAK